MLKRERRSASSFIEVVVERAALIALLTAKWTSDKAMNRAGSCTKPATALAPPKRTCADDTDFKSLRAIENVDEDADEEVVAAICIDVSLGDEVGLVVFKCGADGD
jgi:hypothetical protein